MRDALIKIYQITRVFLAFVWKVAVLFLKWCGRLTDTIAARTGYATAYLLVGIILGAATGLFIGGMGIAALGGAIGVSGFLVFTLAGALTGRWAGLEKDRKTTK